MASQTMKAVVFRVGTVEFGIDVHQVVSIERLQPVTTLPNMPPFVAGVMDLRGVITPVVNLRAMISSQGAHREDSAAEEQRILVVSIDENLVGLIVDAATDVVEIERDGIQKPRTDLFGVEDADFLTGIVRLNERLLILLDAATLLRHQGTLTQLSKLVEAVEAQSIQPVEGEAL